MDRRIYMTDGWNRLQVWDGIGATTQDAGIDPPDIELTGWSPIPVRATSSGAGWTAGRHLMRYRYMNSKTGYVSEPSAIQTEDPDNGGTSATFLVGDPGATLGPHATGLAITATTITRDSGSWVTDGFAIGDLVTLANAENSANNASWRITGVTATVLTIGAGGLTANADDTTATWTRAGAGRIRPSDDPKVDRIVFEMTLAGGSVFYKAAEIANPSGDSTLTVDISDESLAQNTLLWAGEDGDVGIHNVPPITKHVIEHRGRLFAFGQVVHTTGTVDVTNNSTTVTGTGTGWTDALGGGVTGLQRHPRFFQVEGESAEYEIDEATSATGLTLVDAYGGSTASGVNYRIYSRDNFIYVSEPGFPESFPLLNFMPGATGGPTRAVVGVLSGMLLCADVGMDYLGWTDDPVNDGVRRTASKERGAVSQRVCLTVEERAYGLDQRGIWEFDGVAPRAISREIETVIARINWAVAETFHAVWCPRLRAIRWWVALDSDTLPKHYLQLHVDRIARSAGGDGSPWSMGQREVAVTASETVPTNGSGIFGGARPVVGDENGHVWVDDEGTTDGADSSPKVLASGTPTTTVVNITGATLPTTGTGLTGVVAHFERLGESRVISANTASQITLASALSSAPVAGDVVWLGRIKAKLKTKAFAPGSMLAKHEGVYVHVVYVPLTTQRFAKLRVYRDYAAADIEWGSRSFGDREDEPARGTVHPGPGEDFKIDLSAAGGRVRVGLGPTNATVTEVELEILESDTPAKILGVAVEALERESLE
jgi:hypothetical protein